MSALSQVLVPSRPQPQLWSNARAQSNHPRAAQAASSTLIGSCSRAKHGRGLRTSLKSRATARAGAAARPKTNGRILRHVACSASLDEPSLEGGELQMMMELPCLPFNPAEVLVPASTKVLHLYEARYLALLEEAMNKTQGLFAHIILEPMRAEGREMSFVASHCCLCFIESVRRLEIGALISVRGITRLRLLTLTQMEPFLKGSVTLQPDQAQESPERDQELGQQLEQVKDLAREVQRLQIRLKSPGDSPLQTTLEESIQWAEKALSGKIPYFTASPPQPPSPPKDPSSVSLSMPPWPSQTQSLEGFLPSRAELVAFAALQPVTAASPAELHRLLQKRLQAMETLDSLRRIQLCRDYAEDSRASLAAKLALQGLVR